MKGRKKKCAYGDYIPNDPYYTENSLNTLSKPQVQQPSQSFFNSQKGQGIGTAVNMVASALPSSNTPGKTQSEKDISSLGTSVASALGPWWGALAQVGTKASDSLRDDDNVSHSQGFLADQLDPFHQFNSLSEGGTEEKIMSFLNPIGASHLAAGRRKDEARARQRREKAVILKEGQERLGDYNIYGNDNYGSMAKYGAYLPKMPNGGRIPYPTDGSEVDVLASNVAQYNGPTHDKGGIDLDTNMDHNPDIEIENKEVVKDNMVLSNRLKPSLELLSVVKKLGISPGRRATYASIAAKVGERKGKFEKNLQSTRIGEKTSAELMTQRLDETIDMLFTDQQLRKHQNNEEMVKFPLGGMFPPDPTKPITPNSGVAGPRYLPQDPRTTPEQNAYRARYNVGQAQAFKNLIGGATGLVPAADYTELTRRDIGGEEWQTPGGGKRGYVKVDPLAIQRADSVINTRRQIFPQTGQPSLAGRAYGGYLPKYATGDPFKAIPYTLALNNVSGYDIYDTPSRQSLWGNQQMPVYTDPKRQVQEVNLNIPTPNTDVFKISGKNPLDKGNFVASNVPYPVGQEQPFKAEARNFDIGDYKGDIAAGIGTIANQILINKTKTGYQADLTDLPTKNYTDRTGFLRNEINQQFRTASQGINSSSAQDNQALKSNLYAKSLNALTGALDVEQQRKDRIDESHSQLVNRTKLYNTQTKNQYGYAEQQNKNAKLAATQANLDNLVRSYIGNEYQRDLKTKDYATNAIISSMSGDRGVFERWLAKQDPKTRRSLGYK